MKNKMSLFVLAIPILIAASCGSVTERSQGGDVSRFTNGADDDSISRISERCVTTPPRSIPDHFPQSVREAISRLPSDAIVGIGVSRFRNIGAARRGARQNAYADISRQLGSVVLVIFADYLTESEVDPSVAVSFLENVVLVISESLLVGLRTVVEHRDDDGDYWVVVELPQANAASEIAWAVQAASLRAVDAPDHGLQAALTDVDRVNAAIVVTGGLPPETVVE